MAEKKVEEIKDPKAKKPEVAEGADTAKTDKTAETVKVENPKGDVEQAKEETTQTEVPAPKPRRTKKKTRRTLQDAKVYIKATFNNTIVTLTDQTGGVLLASSAGANGFRGSKKGTAYAAGVAGEKVATAATQDFGVKNIEIYVKGVGLGREAAIRAFANLGMSINAITDNTPLPHGGVRPKGERKP